MKPRHGRDDARQTRDLLLFALGFLGLLIGVIFAYNLQPANPPEREQIAWALAFATAVTATLMADIIAHLVHKRVLAMLLLKLAMFLFNAMLLAAEFMVFIYAAAPAK